MSKIKPHREGLRLETAHRHVRVRTGGVRLAHRSLREDSASTFAQAIRQRYQGWRRRWPSLDQVFRQSRSRPALPAVHHSTVFQRTHLYLAPRLALTLLTLPTLYFGAPRQTLEPAPIRRRMAFEQRMVNHLVRQPITGSIREHYRIERLMQRLHTWERIETTSTVRLVRLVQQLVSRGIRIVAAGMSTAKAAMVASPSDPAFLQAGLPHIGMRKDPLLYFPPVQPVPRILRRPAAVATMEGTTPGAERTGFGAAGQVPSTGTRTTAPSRGDDAVLEAIDVNRLTDRIVQTIDRRIIAQRERLGRL